MTKNSADSPVLKLAVVGQDITLWSAVIALQQALGPAGVCIDAVELPSLLSEHDAYAVANWQGFELASGFNVAITTASGVPITAHRFDGWASQSNTFFKVLVGQDGSDDAVTRALWTRGRRDGLTVPFENLFDELVAAKSRRVAAGWAAASADGRSLVRSLAARAVSMGASHRRSQSVQVEVEGDRICRIVLGQGQAVEADLFVDASGPQATLISHLPATPFVASSNSFCDRSIVGSARSTLPLPPYGRSVATREGWIGFLPLQDRTAISGGFSSLRSTQAKFFEEALRIVPGLNADLVLEERASGSLRTCWVGNCVAIGDTAVRTDPLTGAAGFVLETSLRLLFDLFPANSPATHEAAAYNSAMARYAQVIEDYEAAHYIFNRRDGERFWDEARSAVLSDELEHRRTIFCASAMMMHQPCDLSPACWATLMIGMGILPVSEDLRIDKLPLAKQIDTLRSHLLKGGTGVEHLPDPETVVVRIAGEQESRVK